MTLTVTAGVIFQSFNNQCNADNFNVSAESL